VHELALAYEEVYFIILFSFIEMLME